MIEVRTLRDGGQRADDVADWIARFLADARRSLDFAHYDFHLKPETASIVGDAMRDARHAGSPYGSSTTSTTATRSPYRLPRSPTRS